MKFKKLYICLAIISLLGLTFINAFYINPKTITVRQETITTNNPDLSDLTVVFFSDLHFNTSINTDNIEQLTALVNAFDPDIILFGGDLVDHYSLKPLSGDDETILVDNLRKMHANLAKYAVYGNHDIDSPLIKENVTRILNNADFEILNNTSTKVYRNKKALLNVVGIDSIALGNPDVETAYRVVDEELFTIALCHTADIFDDINTAQTNLLLSGHSHGGQIYLPLLNTFYRPLGTKNYFKGKFTKDNTLLDITNGVGTTLKDIRLLADAEIVVYKFN